jgi:small-conductance mechanosensitive channel
MARLEDLTRGAQVKGLHPDGVVTIIDVTWHGAACAEAATVRTNTKIEPAPTPGRERGITTSRNIRQGPAPRLCDASSRARGMFWITGMRVRIM